MAELNSEAKRLALRSLEHTEYVTQTRASWGVLPLGMTVIEFCGTGDSFFGGSADDRVLGKDGAILPRGADRQAIAQFHMIEEAHEAAKRINNRRPGSILGVAPWWR